MKTLTLIVLFTVLLHPAKLNAQANMRWGNEYAFRSTPEKTRELSISADSSTINLVEYDDRPGTSKGKLIHIEYYDRATLNRIDSFTVNTGVLAYPYYQIAYQFTKKNIIFLITVSQFENIKKGIVAQKPRLHCIVTDFKGNILKKDSGYEDEKLKSEWMKEKIITTFYPVRNGTVAVREHLFSDSIERFRMLTTDTMRFTDLLSGSTGITYSKGVPLSVDYSQEEDDGLYRGERYKEPIADGSGLNMFYLVTRNKYESRCSLGWDQHPWFNCGIRIDHFNKGANKPSEVKFIPFPVGLTNLFSGDDKWYFFLPKWGDHVAGEVKKEEGNLSSRIQFKKIFPGSNGGYTVVLEYFMKISISESANTNNIKPGFPDFLRNKSAWASLVLPGNDGWYLHHVILKIDPKGNLLEYMVIPKRQEWGVWYDPVATKLFCSFSILDLQNGKLNMVYNDHKKNFNRTSFNDMSVLDNAAKAATFIAKDDLKGGYSKNILLPSENSKDPFILSNISLKVGNSEYAVMAVDPKLKKYKIGILRLD